MKLPQLSHVPLFGMVSRMADQKGFDLIMGSVERLLSQKVQMVFLGSGEPSYEAYLRNLAARYPEQVAVEIGFDESLSHQIEAGADAFLMPSRFEPCGLNQMYSQKYGTVPIVRRVGGLADSVVNLDNNPDAATGFMFEDYNRDVFAETTERAIKTYGDKNVWSKLMQNGMTCDFSWNRSAAKYVDVYRRASERISGRAAERRS